jgi:hypothetical protein
MTLTGRQVVAAFLFLIVGNVGMAACGSDPSDNDPKAGSGYTGGSSDAHWYVDIVDTPNGPIECIYARYGEGGGPTCNWDKYNNQNEEP